MKGISITPEDHQSNHHRQMVPGGHQLPFPAYSLSLNNYTEKSGKKEVSLLMFHNNTAFDRHQVVKLWKVMTPVRITVECFRTVLGFLKSDYQYCFFRIASYY